MTDLDYDELLQRMSRLERVAFDDFHEHFHKLIHGCCLKHGFDAIRAEIETENCLFAIALRAVTVAKQIPRGRFRLWVLGEARSLLFPYWRDQPSTLEESAGSKAAASGVVAPPHPAWEIIERLRQPSRHDRHFSQELGLPWGWLRRQLRRLAARVARWETT